MKIVREMVPYLLIVFFVIIVRTFFVTPVRVDGPSMNYTLADGQILLLNKTIRTYKRMEIVVFDYNHDRLIKRVIGVPGDSVEIRDNKLYINNEEVPDYKDDVKTDDFKLSELGVDKIPEGYYFVMGDNRYNSVDSRMIGLIPKSKIKGRVVWRFFPLTKFGSIK